MRNRPSPLALAAVTVLCFVLGAPLAAAQDLEFPGGSFSDDNGSVHEANIEAIAAAGITTGCREGADHFCPTDPVSREQMASFLVRALGLAPAQEDYFVDDGGIHEANINALRLAGITTGCREGADHFCPTDPVSREQMASGAGARLGARRTVPWRLELVVDRVEGGTTDLQAPAGDDRLFRAPHSRHWIAFLPEPFLAGVRKDASERMLGLAFHPSYADNGRFYVFYTDLDGHSQVYEYQVKSDDPNRADPESARRVITFEQRPTSPTHKGGQLQFGPGGYLYIAVGDGGGAGDPFGHGQNPHTELGTIVRIDVDGGAIRHPARQSLL